MTNPALLATAAHVTRTETLLDAAKMDLLKDEQGLDAANTAHTAAIVAGGDVAAAQAAVVTAETALRFATDRVPVLERGLADARQAQRLAYTESYRPTWDAGVAVRLAAAEAADAANAALAQAHAEAARGAQMIQAARARGFGERMDPMTFSHALAKLLPAAEETAKWEELSNA